MDRDHIQEKRGKSVVRVCVFVMLTQFEIFSLKIGWFPLKSDAHLSRTLWRFFRINHLKVSVKQLANLCAEWQMIFIRIDYYGALSTRTARIWCLLTRNKRKIFLQSILMGIGAQTVPCPEFPDSRIHHYFVRNITKNIPPDVGSHQKSWKSILLAP